MEELSATIGLSVTLGPQGRVVIPSKTRELLGLQNGDKLVCRVEDGRLVLESRANILRRLQAKFGAIPKSVKLVDELIADRRRESARENNE